MRVALSTGAKGLVVALAFGPWACGGDDIDNGGNGDDDSPAADAAPDTPDAAVDDTPDAAVDTPDAADEPDAEATPDAAPPPPDATPPAEACGNGSDDDLDGKADCDDADCATQLTCQVAACPAGQVRVTAGAEGLPRFFVYGSTLAVPLPIAQAGVVTMAAVKLSAVHPYAADVLIKLRSPTGTVVTLTQDAGGSGKKWDRTIFTDEAATAVSSGADPFNGKFKPKQALSGVSLQASAGTWTLEATDDYDDSNNNSDVGVLASAELLLCVCENCELGGACSDGLDNDGDMNADCADSDCAGDVRCIPETNCSDNVDNDLDGLKDCLDPQCNGLGICQYPAETSCSDSNDNDADGAKDCFDPDCSNAAFCLPESNCSDLQDNDMDGKRDCADPGCAAITPCEAKEASCNDGFDNDGDNIVDCADGDCALECTVGACPPGLTKVDLTTGTIAVVVPDGNTTGVTVPLTVTTTGNVGRVAVGVNLTHPWAGDADIFLVGPDGTSVDLSSGNGSSGDNYTNTVFSDQAQAAITSGSPPYSGIFKPEAPLSVLNGKGAMGEWKLKVVDDLTPDQGTITRFDLYLCVSP